MISNMFLVCLLVGALSSCASLSCTWMEHKFRQYSDNSLILLDNMVNNSTNSTEDAEDAVAFPNELYRHATAAPAQDRLGFVVQILEESTALFEQHQSSPNGTVWDQSTVEDFVNVVTQQADGLRSCIPSRSHKRKNKKLNLYFNRLSHHVEQMGHSADAWEVVRTEIRAHLQRADILVSSVLNEN